MATKHLDADLSETPVDQTKYRSMVGALMYLTASRPDIMHATCYCARYQAKPTEKHLTAVKQIFWYLKDTIHIGLWYLKDTGFELTASSDSDHAGCLDSYKSTSCCIQFLGGDKLVSWSSKKQDCTSITEYELADLFTKALPEERFKYLVRQLDQNSSDPAPECQTVALNHDSLSLAIQRQANVSQADRIVKMSNELDLLFSLMFDELLNRSSKVVSKSSVVSTADDPNQRQQYTTPLNKHTTPSPTCQIPSIAPTVISSENINQAETHAENGQVADDEFINIFSTPV
nr:uncharacterized mitochondrial protein AtMg00810-like [Tanacetum cinerariifolium]